MEELFRVGVISNTHGIRGEVKVYPTTDNVRRFDDLKEVILDTGKEQLDLHVTSVKYFKNMVILKFKEFDNICVSFSGGKDSGVLLNLCIDYIRRNNLKRKLSGRWRILHS